MSYDKEKAKVYQQRYKERKEKGETRPYKKKSKVGEWKVEKDTQRDVAIATTKLNFKYVSEDYHGLYYDKGYWPLYRDIKVAAHPVQIIISRKESNLSIYIKGIDNLSDVTARVDEVIKRYDDENPDKVIKVKDTVSRHKYYMNDRDENIEKQKQYYAEHKAEIQEYKKKYKQEQKKKLHGYLGF